MCAWVWCGDVVKARSRDWVFAVFPFRSLVLEMLCELQESACLPSIHLMWLVEARTQVLMVAQDVPEPLLHSLYLTLVSALACLPAFIALVRYSSEETVPSHIASASF